MIGASVVGSNREHFKMLQLWQLKTGSTDCHHHGCGKTHLNYVKKLFGEKTKSLIPSLTDLIMKQCGVGPCSGENFRQTLLKHQPAACFIHPASLTLTFFKLYCLCIAIHA